MSEKKIQIGGQAVIEGVMMRGEEQIATAIRRKDGSIDLWTKGFVSVTQKHLVWKRPIIRGFVSLIEMLKIGIQTLNFSADRYELDYQEEGTEVDPKAKQRAKIGEILTIIGAFALALGLFGFVPYLVAELLQVSKQNFLYNLLAGSIRIIFFFIYVYLISLMKDIRRVFEYHGAEHKSVFAHEQGLELTIDNVRPFTTIHPRCGTSFMFLVLLISILVFSILDTFVTFYFGQVPSALVRFLYHLPFIPLISGIGYEVIKLSGKKQNNIFIKIITYPGMFLQRFTTRQPDDQQIETAIIALKAALKEDLSAYENISIVGANYTSSTD